MSCCQIVHPAMRNQLEFKHTTLGMSLSRYLRLALGDSALRSIAACVYPYD